MASANALTSFHSEYVIIMHSISSEPSGKRKEQTSTKTAWFRWKTRTNEFAVILRALEIKFFKWLYGFKSSVHFVVRFGLINVAAVVDEEPEKFIMSFAFTENQNKINFWKSSLIFGEQRMPASQRALFFWRWSEIVYLIGNSDTDEGLLTWTWITSKKYKLKRKKLFAIISGMWARVWATRAILHSICQLQVAIIKINWSSTPCSMFICRRENRVHFALVSAQSKQLQQTNFVMKWANCVCAGMEQKIRGRKKLDFAIVRKIIASKPMERVQLHS